VLRYVRHLFDHKFAVADCTFHAEPATNKRSFSAQKKQVQMQSNSTKIGNSNAQRLPVKSQLVVVLLAYQQFESTQMMMAKAERFAQ
jgi:hypothetical protein